MTHRRWYVSLDRLLYFGQTVWTNLIFVGISTNQEYVEVGTHHKFLVVLFYQY